MWETILQAIARIMGLGTDSVAQAEAGMVMSFVFTMFFIVLVELASQGKRGQSAGAIGAVVTGLISTIFFTAILWYPIWVGVMLAFVLALFTGWMISNATKTGGS